MPQIDSNGAILDTSYASDATVTGSGGDGMLPEVTVTGHTEWWIAWVAGGIFLGWLLFDSRSPLRDQ